MLHRRHARYAAAILGVCLGAGCGATDVTSVRQALGSGADGVGSISMPGTVVNRYARLGQDARRDDGALVLSSAPGEDLTALMPIAAGDVILIIQMQGAQIDVSNSGQFGSILDYGGSGNFEFIGVQAVDTANNRIVVDAQCNGLRNNYRAAGQVQIIRVPQYASLDISAGSSVTAPPWNGATGGVVAIHVKDGATINGTIDVSALGFRGGKKSSVSTMRPPGLGDGQFYSISSQDGGMKGEGIAGWPTQGSVPYAPFGMGAPANGGGGGNRIASGGGGGGGSGDVKNWNGVGIMDLTVTGGAQAWLLDPAYDAARQTFAGGGRGGYTATDAAIDPTTTAPNMQSWGQDFRRAHGGLGGRPLGASAASAVYFGGGGGSGDDFMDASGGGGTGGGIILLGAGSIQGGGAISADGGSGEDATSTQSGAGGGGGGGAIVISAQTFVGPTLSAVGGAGGGLKPAKTGAGGPGGGGGGGYIATSSGASPGALSASGGRGGTTNSLDMVGFPSNGATEGADGIENGTISPTGGSLAACMPVDVKATLDASPAAVTLAQPFTVTASVSNIGTGQALQVQATLSFPAGTQVTDISAAGWTCMQDPNSKIHCTLDSLDPGAATPIVVTMTPPQTLSTLPLSFTVTTSSHDIDPTNDSAQAVVTNGDPLIPRTAGGGFACSIGGGGADIPGGGALGAFGLGLLLTLLRGRRRALPRRRPQAA